MKEGSLMQLHQQELQSFLKTLALVESVKLKERNENCGDVREVGKIKLT